MPERESGLRWVLQVILPVVMAGALMGCSRAAPYVQGELKGRSGIERLERNILDLYPPDFQMVHRAVLRAAGGREYEMIGYLAVDHRGRARLKAMTDMGIPLFDLLLVPGEGTRIVRNAAGSRRSWLEEGAANDIRRLFLFRTATDFVPVRDEEGNAGFTALAPGGELVGFSVDPGSGLLNKVSYLRRGRVVYEACFEDYLIFPQLSRKVPGKLVVRNIEMGYTLTVRVLKVEPGGVTDRMFEME